MTWKKPHSRPRRQSPTFDTWHGTRHPFKEFKISKCEFGIHSGTKAQAETCVGKEDIPEWPLRRMIPLKVELKNPLRLEDTGQWNAQGVWAQLVDKNIVSDPGLETLFKLEDLPRIEADAFVRSEILKRGYDGVVYLNRAEGIDEDELAILQESYDTGSHLSDNDVRNIAPSARDSYIAFNTSQIKRRSL